MDVPPKTVEKKTAKVKSKAPKKVAPDHPKYLDMIVETLTKLKDRKGTSRMALLKYIVENYKVNKDVEKVRVPLNCALTIGLSAGTLKMARATGKGSASYKIGELPKVKKPVKKPKKPVAKKSAAKPKKGTKTKKDSKKTKPKKAAAAKTKKTLKKVAKKPAVKKPVAKKLAAKKPAAKKTVKKAGIKK